LEINHYQLLLAKEYRKLLKEEEHSPIIEHIHLLREQEKKLLDCVSQEDSIILFEILLTHIMATCSEIDIIKSEQTFFSSNRRLLQQLITIMSEDDDFDSYLKEIATPHAREFLVHNYYSASVSDPFGYFINLNKNFGEDHAYLFLGLLDQNKEKISIEEYKKIYYEFLYLYPDIFESIIDKNRKITRESSQILASTYHGRATFFDEKYDFNGLKELFCYQTYYDSVKALSTIKDEELEQEKVKRKFFIYQLYIQSALESISYHQIPNVITMFNQIQEAEPSFFNKENKIALETLNKINSAVYETKKTYQK